MQPQTLVIGLLFAMMAAKVSQGQALNIVYHAAVNFTCDPDTADLDDESKSNFQVPGNVYRLWILPNGKVLKPNCNGTARVALLDEGKMLHVRRVEDDDFGWYLCLVRINARSSVHYVVDKHGINVDGPYFGDLSEKYRGMAVTGAVSGAICVVVAGMICFLYNKHQARWDKDPEEQNAAREAAAAAEAEQLKAQQGAAERTQEVSEKPAKQYTNPAFVPDGEDGGGGVAGADEDKPRGQHPAVVVHAEEAVPKKKGKAPMPPTESRPQPQRELESVVAGGDGDGGNTTTVTAAAASAAAASASNVLNIKL